MAWIVGCGGLDDRRASSGGSGVAARNEAYQVCRVLPSSDVARREPSTDGSNRSFAFLGAWLLVRDVLHPLLSVCRRCLWLCLRLVIATCYCYG